MNKKTCLITGPTSGLGKSISIKLANQGYKLILVSKSKSKLMKLSNQLGKKNIKYFTVDLSNYNELKNFVKKKLYFDVLINNAESFFLKKEKNNVIFNKTFTLNYLSPYILIKKLIIDKKLKNKLIINLSSNALLRSKINISDIKDINLYNGWEIYKFSKLLNHSMTNYLSKKYRYNNFFSFNPGRMKTNFGSNNNFIVRNLNKIYLRIFGKNLDSIANKIIKIIKTNKMSTKDKVNVKEISYINKIDFQKKLILQTNKLLKFHVRSN